MTSPVVLKPARPFEPMTAATLEDPGAQLNWEAEWRASVKLDGYRCVVKDGVALSRNLKPIRNKYVQHLLGSARLNGLDGELICGEPVPQHDKDSVVGRTSSGVTSVAGEPALTFWVFDDFTAHAHPYRHRIGRVEDRLEDLGLRHLRLVPHHVVRSPDALRRFETSAVEEGFEGVMLRHAEGPYKHGRATEKEGWLWKLKRFIDGEALINQVVEGQHNENEAKQDEMGRVKRSTEKAGMRPNGLVGTILATDLKTGDKLEIAPGCMTAAERQYYMQHPEELKGRIAKYKAFDYGVKDRLRHVTFVALRHPSDMPA